jgi:hypothetical protein
MSELTPEADVPEAQRIVRTGIALVHANEVILPALGSEAQAEQVGEDARAGIVYQFPVIVDVRGPAEPTDPATLREHALSALARELA